MNSKRALLTTITAMGVLMGVATISYGDAPEERIISQTAGQTSSWNAGEQIKWQVIAGGGVRGSSNNFVLSGTTGQTAVGTGSSTNFGINQGYWQDFTVPCLCGDANNSGAITISDAVFVIGYIFGGGPAPDQTCLGDANGTGNVNISDAVFIISFIFGGGPTPHCP